ncbi:MAG: hypothetical protein OQK82_06410 [Candidatus Pacearchaeota archaeon]|nr:hypothetical protein [Candidatus Pacearchaeota archaeon]
MSYIEIKIQDVELAPDINILLTKNGETFYGVKFSSGECVALDEEHVCYLREEMVDEPYIQIDCSTDIAPKVKKIIENLERGGKFTRVKEIEELLGLLRVT